MARDKPDIKPQYKLVAANYIGKAAGNAERACIMAGYSKSYARGNAYKIVARKDVQEYIEYLQSVIEEQGEIASIEQIQTFWTAIMNDKGVKPRDRLRASELLAKVQGAFKKEDDW